MSSGRIHRAGIVLLGAAVVVAALALERRPAGLPPPPPSAEGFSGSYALSQLRYLAATYPRHAPGTVGDREIANYVAAQLGADGFLVHTVRFTAPTVRGRRNLRLVVARRAGTSGGPPLVVVAHRDSAPNGSYGVLSATAELLALAKSMSALQLNHPLLFVSTSGGSGGFGGAQKLATLLSAAPPPWLAPAPVPGATEGTIAAPAVRQADAVMVVSSVVGAGPLAVAEGGNPALGATVRGALRDAGLNVVGPPGTTSRALALALPFARAERAPFEAAGIPTVEVEAQGEGALPSRERLQAVGEGLAGTLQALDGMPLAWPPTEALPVGGALVPAWALRLAVAVGLCWAALALLQQLLAGLRRGLTPGRTVLAPLAWSAPFLAAALLLALGGATGLAGGLEAVPRSGGTVAPGAAGYTLSALSLLLLCLFSAALLRRGHDLTPAGGAAALLGGGLFVNLVAWILWLGKPLAAFFLLPACLLWPLAAGLRSRSHAVSVVALGACVPLALLAYLCASWPSGSWLPFNLAASGALAPGTLILGCLLAGAAVASLRGARTVRPVPLSRPAASRRVTPPPVLLRS